jgi:hypothetical protein
MVIEMAKHKRSSQVKLKFKEIFIDIEGVEKSSK